MLGAFEVISPWSDVNEMKRTIRGGRMVTVVDDTKQAIDYGEDVHAPSEWRRTL